MLMQYTLQLQKYEVRGTWKNLPQAWKKSLLFKTAFVIWGCFFCRTFYL